MSPEDINDAHGQARLWRLGLPPTHVLEALEPRLLLDGGPGSKDTAYYDAVLAMGPIAYYRFDESAGATLVDASGSGLDGAYIGDPTLGATGAFGTSNDPAATFDGTDDWAEVPDDGTLDLRRQVAAAFWVHVDSFTNTWSPLLYKGDATQAARTYAIWLQNNGSLAPGSSDAAGLQWFPSAAGTIQVGQWHHVVFSADRDTGQMNLYVDGQPAGSDTVRTTDTVSHNQPLLIGQTNESNASYSPLNGTIDELALFDHALSAQDPPISTRPPRACTSSSATRPTPSP